MRPTDTVDFGGAAVVEGWLLEAFVVPAVAVTMVPRGGGMGAGTIDPWLLSEVAVVVVVVVVELAVPSCS